MKQTFLILSTVFVLIFSGCKAYTGIAQGETEDIYYVIATGGELLKCKRFGMRVVCIKAHMEEVDLETYRARQKHYLRQQQGAEPQAQPQSQNQNRDFSPVPQSEETRTRLRSQVNRETR